MWYYKGVAEKEEDFSIKFFFVPFTTLKAIHYIVLLGIIVYANVLFNGLVWDDNNLFSPEITQFKVLDYFGISDLLVSYYRPFSLLYIGLLYKFFGATPFYYHLNQIILHIAVSSLLFLFFKKFINQKISFILALIFLIHPIQVESVAWIAGTQSQVRFLLCLSALIISLKENIKYIDLIVISALLLSAFLVYEASFLFLILILLYQYLFFRKRVKKFFISIFSFTFIYFLLRYSISGFGHGGDPFSPISKLPFFERMINIPAVFFYYIKTFFYPVTLSIDQFWIVTSIDFTHFYFPLIMDILFFTVIILVWLHLFKTNKKLHKLFLFFFIWFFLGIGMFMQVLPLDMTVADRWFYFPIAGLLGMIGVGISSIKHVNKNIKVPLYVFAAIIILLFSARTFIRNFDWKDALTLYSHDAKIEVNYDLENNLASELNHAKRYKEALPHAIKAVELFPYETTYFNLALVYKNLGNYDKAEYYFEKSTKSNHLNPKYKERFLELAYWDLAQTYLRREKYQTAKDFILKVQPLYPKKADFWAYLAIAEYKLGNKDEALKAAKKAYSINPTSNYKEITSLIEKNQPINITND